MIHAAGRAAGSSPQREPAIAQRGIWDGPAADVSRFVPLASAA
jgi:hypothetical protein